LQVPSNDYELTAWHNTLVTVKMALLNLIWSNHMEKLSALLRWEILVLVAISLAIASYLRKTTKAKPIDLQQYSRFPQPEPADPVRGHWPWIEKAAAEGDPRRAFDEMLYEQAEKLGFPPVLLVDFRPIEKFPILFILDNDVAEQVTKPNKTFRNSMPKHPSLQQLAPLVGARSLVTTDVSSTYKPYLLLSKRRKLIIISGRRMERAIQTDTTWLPTEPSA